MPAGPARPPRPQAGAIQWGWVHPARWAGQAGPGRGWRWEPERPTLSCASFLPALIYVQARKLETMLEMSPMSVQNSMKPSSIVP